MLNPKPTSPILISPCGINCRLCRAFVREKKACPGCRCDDHNKSNACITCKIKNCDKRIKSEIEYCFDCDQFPCAPLKHLDVRYRTNYATSPIDNLNSIKEIGINAFVESENSKWACPECGAVLCMHKPYCLVCGHVWHK